MITFSLPFYILNSFSFFPGVNGGFSPFICGFSMNLGLILCLTFSRNYNFSPSQSTCELGLLPQHLPFGALPSCSHRKCLPLWTWHAGQQQECVESAGWRRIALVSGLHTAGSSAPGPTSIAGAVCSVLDSEEDLMSMFQACHWEQKAENSHSDHGNQRSSQRSWHVSWALGN